MSTWTFGEFVSAAGRFPNALECVFRLKVLGAPAWYSSATGFTFDPIPAGTSHAQKADIKTWQACLKGHANYVRDAFEDQLPRNADLTDEDFLEEMFAEGFAFDFDEEGWIQPIDCPDTSRAKGLFCDFYLRWSRLNDLVRARFENWKPFEADVPPEEARAMGRPPVTAGAP